MELRTFIQRYPNVFYLSTASTAALFGLTMTPTFVPVVFTLAALLLYAPVLFHRPNPYVHTALLWFSMSLCSSFGRLIPALAALSTAGPSIAVLLSMSAVASAVAILAIFADVFVSSRTGWAQAVLFPAIWTSLWVGISHLPLNLGRLTSWSPMSGIQAYQWMAPWTGPAGVDWVTAAWAVVVSQSIGIWYMGSMDEDDIPTTAKRNSRSAKTWVLALILTALTIPSFVLPASPLPAVSSDTVSSFQVGCVLPFETSPGLQKYIDESVELNSQGKGTKLLLWPEGAVSFRNASEKDAAFASIQHALESNHHAYWGVSFEVRDTSDISGTSTSHMGLALLSHEGVHMDYYKRFLVPIAESFRLTPGSSPPPTFPIPLLNPRKKAKWNDHTVDVTASICLDFAIPSPFWHLNSKPGMILAPARTWDRAIGNRMWEEVKQRANEVGSLALWCDGGQGGVSGVAGSGYNDFYQVGEGSWSRPVGIPYPFHSTPTVYARVGDASIVAASWFLVFGPIAFAMIAIIIDFYFRTGQRPAFHHEGSLKCCIAVSSFAGPTDLRHPTSGQSPSLLSRPARSPYGPVSSTRSNLPSGPVQKPSVPSLGSFQLITSRDLPIRLDDSPKCKRSSSVKPRATPTTSRVTFLGSFLHHLRRLRSFAAKSFRRRRPHKDHRSIVIENIGSRKVEEPNIHQDSSLPPRLFQRVNTCELGTSVSSSIFEDEPTPSTPTSAPPSPSWLSRNIEETTPTQNSEETPDLAPPSSPLDVSSGILKQPKPVTPVKPHLTHSKENLSTYKSPKSDSPSVSKAEPHPTAKPPLTTSSNPNLSSTRATFIHSVPGFEPGPFPLSDDLKSIINSVNMDFTGKQAAEVVDFGGEVDYANYRWFQDAPPKQPPAQQSVGTPYVPLPGVIEQNEAFEFALSAAPNVLYARYKQYGQLGVLAWCSEFGELIDNLKDLGFKGNMFVATRTQALRTCEDLLRLTKESLDLKMQIIVMYLSSQVARLRRFLDGDKTWDDYPEPQFPDYKKYSNLAGEFA
ncbi:hypothetical protein B0H12DRAFT_1073218 [Mycena haematopus]|nr:hypothetical protein B0H12DRAFT_1073218 [Mycena haematopus]